MGICKPKEPDNMGFQEPFDGGRMGICWICTTGILDMHIVYVYLYIYRHIPVELGSRLGGFFYPIKNSIWTIWIQWNFQYCIYVDQKKIQWDGSTQFYPNRPLRLKKNMVSCRLILHLHRWRCTCHINSQAPYKSMVFIYVLFLHILGVLKLGDPQVTMGFNTISGSSMTTEWFGVPPWLWPWQ
jgi:hypothetical protein